MVQTRMVKEVLCSINEHVPQAKLLVHGINSSILGINFPISQTWTGDYSVIQD